MSIKGENKEEMIEVEIVNNIEMNETKGLPHLLKHEADNLKSYYALLEHCKEDGKGYDLLTEFCGNTIKNIEKITKLIKGKVETKANEESKDKSE